MKRNRRSSNIRDSRDTVEQIAQEALEEEEFQRLKEKLMDFKSGVIPTAEEMARAEQLVGKEQDTRNRRHMKSRRRMHEQRIDEPPQGDDAIAKLGRDTYNAMNGFLYDYYDDNSEVPLPRPRPLGY